MVIVDRFIKVFLQVVRVGGMVFGCVMVSSLDLMKVSSPNFLDTSMKRISSGAEPIFFLIALKWYNAGNNAGNNASDGAQK